MYTKIKKEPIFKNEAPKELDIFVKVISALLEKIRENISIPVTVLGGAGTLDHIGEVIKQHGIIGVAAGSLFVFKGKYKAVLINYPNPEEKQNLLNRYFIKE